MDFKLYIIQFLNDLRYQKLRAFLTLFGIIWGTTAIISLMAVSEAQERTMLRDLKSIGENIVIIWPRRTSLPFMGFGRGRRLTLLPEDVKILRDNVAGIDLISGEKSSEDGAVLSYKKVEDNITLTGIEPAWAIMRNVQAELPGRFISQKDLRLNHRVVFLGNDVKETYFGTEDALGKIVYINKIPFRVIGVMQEKYQARRRGGKDSERIYIPLSTLLIMDNVNSLNSIVFSSKDILDSDYVVGRVRQTFAKIKMYSPKDKSALGVWNTGDQGEWIANFSFGIQIFFAIVGLFTIVVAGIGVANIMNVIVEERTREIGIKMSLGMKRKIVMIQFMFETFLLITLGGILGLILSLLICFIISSLKIESIGPTFVTWQSALYAITILGLVAFLAGYFPARRASNLNPVEALRWQ